MLVAGWVLAFWYLRYRSYEFVYTYSKALNAKLGDGVVELEAAAGDDDTDGSQAATCEKRRCEVTAPFMVL